VSNIRDALLDMDSTKPFLKRKAWESTVRISQCNGTLYIHSHMNDPLGREWKPTVEDLTRNDWVALKRFID
jgi:hypothetical protein